MNTLLTALEQPDAANSGRSRPFFQEIQVLGYNSPHEAKKENRSSEIGP